MNPFVQSFIFDDEPVLRRKRPEKPALREVVNIRGFDPEDVKVEVSEDKKKLTVKGRSEVNEDGMIVTRTLDKTFDIPEDCDIAKMQKRHAPGGRLVLFAPRFKKAEEDEEEVSPIKVLNKLFSSESERDEVEETENHFKVALNAEGFKPDHMTVEISPDGKQLTVKGVFEEKTENSVVSRRIHRSFPLPHNVKVDEVKSRFTKDGLLAIEAPKDPSKKMVETEKPRRLQISSEE